MTSVVTRSKSKLSAQGPQVVKAQRQKQAASKHDTVHDHIIKQQQSLELVQTLLTVSFASICYLRRLLPSECFKERDFKSISKNAHLSYQDFLEGGKPDISSADSQLEHQNAGVVKIRPWMLMIIDREKSASAEKVMFWLDGIFDGLSKNFIAAVQLSIIQDKYKPEDVLETYTFSFEYTENVKAAERQLEGLVLSGSHRKSLTISSARWGLETIIQCLVQIAQMFPALPDSRYLTAHLEYTKDCPVDYEPPGFRPSRDPMIIIPDNELWRMKEVKVGQMDSGFHKAGLKVAYLDAILDHEAEIKQDVVIPSNIKHTKPIPRFAGTDNAFYPNKDSAKSANNVISRPVAESSHESLTSKGLSQRQLSRPFISTPTATEQQEEGPRIRFELEKMVRGKTPDESQSPTQRLDHNARWYDKSKEGDFHAEKTMDVGDRCHFHYTQRHQDQSDTSDTHSRNMEDETELVDLAPELRWNESSGSRALSGGRRAAIEASSTDVQPVLGKRSAEGGLENVRERKRFSEMESPASARSAGQ